MAYQPCFGECDRAKRAIALDPDTTYTAHTVLTLPSGYTLTPLTNVTRSTDFAEYKADYAVKNNVITVDLHLHEKVDELPVAQFAAYRDFLKSANNDNGQMLQLVGAGAEAKVSHTVKPDSPEALALMQQAYEVERTGDKVAARVLLDKAKAINDEQSRLWLMYGYADWGGNPDKPIADFRKEIDLHPDDFDAYEPLNMMLIGLKRWTEAEQVLQTWIKADPANARPYAQLGSLQLEQKQYKAAAASFEKAIPLASKPDMLKVSLGQAQLKSGDTKAGEATMQALMSASDDPNVLNDAAYELVEAGLDLPKCEAASRKAVASLEEKVSAITLAGAKNEDFGNVSLLAASWDTLGWIYFKENHLAAADPYLRSAWLILPEDPETGEHVGMLEEAEGKRGDALTTYQITLKGTPHSGLLEAQADRRKHMEDRVAALIAQGVHPGPALKAQQGGDELAALRTYTLRNPLHKQHGSADFLLLLGNNRAEDVSFLKGDEELRSIIPALKELSYRSTVPPESKAKILRRGIVACSDGVPTCLLVLVPPAASRVDN